MTVLQCETCRCKCRSLRGEQSCRGRHWRRASGRVGSAAYCEAWVGLARSAMLGPKPKAAQSHELCGLHTRSSAASSISIRILLRFAKLSIQWFIRHSISIRIAHRVPLVLLWSVVIALPFGALIFGRHAGAVESHKDDGFVAPNDVQSSPASKSAVSRVSRRRYSATIRQCQLASTPECSHPVRHAAPR
jgi:hypothetical protein